MENSASSTRKKHKVLGYGSYGAVIQPALSNVNTKGSPLEFPGMVTKIFYNKKDLDKALSDAALLKEKFPRLAIDYKPYVKTYPLSYFDDNKDVMDALLYGIRHVGKEEPTLYTLRMPFLGDSIFHVANNPRLKSKYYKQPPEKMITEILKLLTIVESLVKAEHVHGDIRDANILVNVETGDLTIIDFDFLTTFDKTLENMKYLKPWWPIEILFLMDGNDKLVERFLKLPLEDVYLDRTYKYKIQELIGKYRHPTLTHGTLLTLLTNMMMDVYHTMLHIEKSMNITRDMAITETMKRLRSACLSTIDTFGLGVALFSLFSAMPKTGEYEPLALFLHDKLIPAMTLANVGYRFHPENIVNNIKNFIRKNYPSVKLDEVPTIQSETARLEMLANVVGEAVPAPSTRKRSLSRSSKEERAIQNLIDATAVVDDIAITIGPPSKPSLSSKSRHVRRRREGPYTPPSSAPSSSRAGGFTKSAPSSSRAGGFTKSAPSSSRAGGFTKSATRKSPRWRN
jgi:serine/threonine protein kinase